MKNNDQLLLDLGGEPSLTRDDLVASAANIDAVSLVDRWPEWPSPWAILSGGKGCGKTHLAQIWAQKSNAHQADPGALNDDDLSHAQAGHRILIDGLEEGGFDETRLFHLMNGVRSASSFMLITASEKPEFWQIKTPDLLSRIKAATHVTIFEPDDALLRAVVEKLFADRQLIIEASVLDFMLTRIERSLEMASIVVERIDQQALANKARVTKPLVRDVIDAMQGAQEELNL